MEITTLLNIPSSAALVGALIFAGAPAGARMRITAAIIASLLALDPIHAAPALPRAVQFTHVENHQPLPTNDEPFPRADGKQLIIESNRTGKQQVYVVEAASGTLVRRVTKNDGTDDSPAWSHNARWISYVGVRKGVTGVYTIAATGGREQRLAGGLDYFHPNWSPDDAWIMYNVNSRAHPDVYELYVMRADGTQKHAITHYGASETTYGSWSPDGKYIAFRRKFPPYRSQVYVANADGTGAHNISNNVFYEGWPSWSPDGRTIVFASNRGERDRASLNEMIYLMSVDGSRQRLLAGNGGRNVEPRFSPDGKFVYFSHCVHHHCEAYRINVP